MTKIIKATLYKSLSNEAGTVELETGKTIAENLPDIDFENALVIVNGKLIRENHTVQEKDIILIRVTPAAATTILAAGLITLAVAAVVGGVIAGVEIYKQKEAAAKMQAELDRMKKMSAKPDLDNRPFLRGASNTLATGNSQPYIIGRHLFTPYLLCRPFYQLAGPDGEQQYIYSVLECGFNKQILQSVSIDEIVIKTFNNTAPQQGVYSIDSGIFAEEGIIEISQDGSLFQQLRQLNYKVISTEANDAIVRDGEVEKHPDSKKYLIYSLDSHAMSVDVAITFPHGLYAFNKDGDKIETEVTITPQYSLDGGKDWYSFSFNNNGDLTNTFKRLVSTKELRYIAHHDFAASDYVTLKANNQKSILLRLRSNGNEDGQIKNDCYCLYYQCVCFDPNKSTDTQLIPCKVIEDRERAFCTTMGIMLKASKANEEKLKKINVITQGIARVWDGAKWSADKKTTRNPAAWALEIETSPAHPVSRYDDTELDLESFGDFYEYCEANKFCFDYVITQNTKKDDVLNYIMDSCGACLYYDIYGRRAVAVDRKQENALAVYNPQNIIKIQNKKTFARQTDGLRIKYINAKDDIYQEDTYLVMREDNGKARELTLESVIKEVRVIGITDHKHIVKHARRLMAIEALRPKITTIEVGNEGIFYTPMSKVLIQDESLKIGLGNAVISECKWRGGLLKKIYLNGTVPVPDAGKIYGVIVNCFTENGGMPVAIKVEAEQSGDVSELAVLSNIRMSGDAIPERGNVLSFGELTASGGFERVTTPYIISNIKRNEKGFILDLVNYHEAIYDSGAIPQYKSNITRRAGTTPPPIPKDNGVTREELQKAIANIDGTKAAQEAADLITHGVRFTNVHRIRDPELTLEGLLEKIDMDARAANEAVSMSEESILLQMEDQANGMRSLIQITRDRILEHVEKENGKLQSSIVQTATDITQTVKDTKKGLETLIQQTEKGILERLKDEEGNLTSIVKTIKGLKTEVSNAEKRVNTTITQTAKGIQTQVTEHTNKLKNHDGKLESHSTSISTLTQTAKGIQTKVENHDGKLKEQADSITKLTQTADNIQATVRDNKKELTSALDLQASAFQALVEGGGSLGRMTLSLELPVMIDSNLYSRFAFVCGKEETIAVYGYFGSMNGKIWYTIKEDASRAAIKTLWDKAVKAGLLASQIQLKADQIVVQNGDKTAAAFIDGKLRAAYIDAENLIVQQLKIDSDQSANQDFEAYFDKLHGLLIKNYGNDILKIDPHTGEAFFNGKVKAGAVELADKGVFLRNGEISIENNGWKGVLRPCANGVELAILGGDGGNMTKKQLWTYISGGILNLFVLGSITSCGGMYNALPDTTPVTKSSNTTNTIHHITYYNGKWFATTHRGGILISNNNGTSWIQKSSINFDYLGNMACNNNIYIVAGKDFFISKNKGKTWEKQSYLAEEYIYHVEYGNGKWIATTTNSLILSNNDGNTWNKKYSFKDSCLPCIVYSNNTWVAVGCEISKKSLILTSKDDGNTWVQSIIPEGKTLQSIAYGNGKWIAVGWNGTIIESRDNGNTWINYSNNMYNIDLYGIAYTSNVWIAVGSKGTIIESRDNGNTWIKKNSETDKNFMTVASYDCIFIVGGQNGIIKKMEYI